MGKGKILLLEANKSRTQPVELDQGGAGFEHELCNLTSLAGGAGNAKTGGDSSNDGISGGGTDAGLNVGSLRSEVPLLSGSGENDKVQVSNV